MDWGKFLGKAVAMVAYLGVLAIVGSYVFFPRQFSVAQLTVARWVGLDGGSASFSAAPQRDTLRIGLGVDPLDMEPTSLDPTVRTMALTVYEPLVRTDRFLNTVPGLAERWGRLSPTTWEFTLRAGVMFHNGKPLGVPDVVASVDRAREFPNSDLRALVADMHITQKGERSLIVTTTTPDALLLQKLALVLVMPREFRSAPVFTPTGTGAYRYDHWKKGSEITFNQNPSYWGRVASYPHVQMLFYPDRSNRVRALQNNDIDIAVQVPIESADELTNNSYAVVTMPSLEVNFLSFGMGGVFKNRGLREAIAHTVDRDVFVTFAGGYAVSSNQFVSSGVFGFNPRISSFAYDMAAALLLVKSVSSFEVIPIRIALVKGFERVGDYLAKQTRAIGFDPQLTYYTWDDFRTRMRTGEDDIYLFGWRSDVGSASDFYLGAVHTTDAARQLGLMNAGRYTNARVDTLIEESMAQFDPAKRLKQYQEIMKILVEDDLYGVPLFESSVLYGVAPDVLFYPRVDGVVVAPDIVSSGSL